MVANPGYWIFQKQSTGTVNRDFAQVTAGSGIYCYEGFASDSQTGKAANELDHWLIEITASEILRIEVRSGNCGSTNSFVSPTEYQR